MSLDSNTTIQQIKDKSLVEQPNETQKWSSVICYIVPVALLKITKAIIDSAMQLAIPLYAISTFPSNSSTIAGILIATQGFGVVLSSTFVGRFIYLTSDEFCILFTISLRSLSIIILLIYDHSLILWIISSIFYGISTGSLAISINHILAKYIKKKKRGRISSVIAGSARLGRGIGPLYVGYIINLKTSLLVSCIISVLSFLIVCCVMLPPNITVDTSNISLNENINTESGSFIYFKEAWKQTKYKKLNIKNWIRSSNKKDKNRAKVSACYVWLKYGKLILFYGLFGFGLRWVRQTRKVILTFRGDELSLSNSNIGTINSVSFILDSLLFVFAGYIMDKWGRKATAIPGLLGFVISLSVVSFAGNFGELLGVAILFGLADGITVGLMKVVTADLAPEECKSQFISSFKIFTSLPKVVAPFVVGYLTTNVSINVASFLSAAIGGIALIWTAFVLKEPSDVVTDNDVKNDNVDINMDSLDITNDNRIMISEIPKKKMLNESLIN